MKRNLLSACLMLLLAGPMMAASLDEDMATYRKDLLEINKRLLLMEEELLFPADTQVTVFVGLDVGRFFTPDSITIKLDGETVDSYLYTDKEVKALKAGAIQKVHTANVKDGEHELTVFVTGLGPNGRPYRRAGTLNFDKGSGRLFIQLTLKDDTASQQALLEFRQWQ
ncbi:MAG: hypothetical protein ACPG43_04170 [Alcanivoracaceae bacterium]